MLKTKLSALNTQDIGLYFNSSFVRVQGLDPEPSWYHFDGFINGDGTFLLNGNNGKREVAAAEWKKSVVFHSLFPHGFFNYKSSTVHCSRIPIRNVSQGLSKNNYSIQSAEEIVSEYGFLKSLSEGVQQHFKNVLLPAARFKWTPKDLNGWLESPKYPENVDKALDEVRRGAKFSCAINSSVAAFPHPAAKGSLIMFDLSPVGECVDPKKVVCLMPAFLQELKDVFIPKGIAVSLKA